MLLLSDEFYMFTLGALECYNFMVDDKEFFQKEIKHRLFFKNLVRYNQAIDFKDKNMINLIHFNYRLNYVKDCALAHILDERALGLIQMVLSFSFPLGSKICKIFLPIIQIVNWTYIEIVRFIQLRKEIMIQIFDGLRQENYFSYKILDEVCQVIKTLEIDKLEFFSQLNDYSIFEIFDQFLC